MKQFCPQNVLPTPAEMAIIDSLASRTVSIEYLMGRAGWAIANALHKRYRPCHTLVLCGPGNNGGDGYVAARYLAEKGWPISVAHYHDRAPVHGEAALAASRWKGRMASYTVEEVAAADLVVDALFGAGLTRALSEEDANLLKAAKKCISVDIPSGLDGKTGKILGYAPMSDLTITFFRPKPGHFLLPGRAHIGALEVYDIGIPATVFNEITINLWENDPCLWTLPTLKIDSYKYSRGLVTVCGGQTMPGAARLSARGARGAGAGLVRIAARDHVKLFNHEDPGIIVDGMPIKGQVADERQKTWVCGPGLTVREVKKILPLLIGHGKNIVADAGALTAFAGKSTSEIVQNLRGVSVITPHIGEFTRVFGPLVHAVADKVEAARIVAQKIDSVVLLKGADTVIAAPDGRAALNHNAPSAVGTAGSGDILSGVVAALIAAGMPVWDAACAAVWIHGECGKLAGFLPRAEDLAACLPQSYHKALFFS
ncbi:NAD(P)H-hydrate dehydratase [Entomobacter blattae]|uniref:Bifunctional NAD(P)H-hydrate repair enzyme n=1 Tax=Entomobacter blattae TaxID=2762277 RepID=A0A7H1NSW3_9PROT|nr:NAD(P)H-hydrate dehydratase [Entomobacter blattae]QNT78873.1 Bifunctional NAD(P)H-hydrate repair enzyme Nnr [Entomobacter blattae]